MISYAANAVSATKRISLTVTRRSSAIGVSWHSERLRDLCAEVVDLEPAVVRLIAEAGISAAGWR